MLSEERRKSADDWSITRKASGASVHRLVKDLCANCDEDGNCLLLDDGEEHKCVQLLSI